MRGGWSSCSRKTRAKAMCCVWICGCGPQLRSAHLLSASPRRLRIIKGQALAWERAAFVRARAAAGDIKAGEAFLADVAPFVWRQALDFGAIEEIRDLTLRIRQSYDGPRRPGPGFDIKRGRGGIREIEFFAQTHQLIHGGRDPALRVRGTRAALDALAAAGWIEDEHARILGEGYDRLRVIEHRLQMVNDRQTHSLPDGEALDGVAWLDGLSDGAALVAELTELTEQTGRIYEGLIGEEQSAEPTPSKPSEKVRLLRDIGFKEPEKLAKRVEEWRDGRFAVDPIPAGARRVRQAAASASRCDCCKSDDPERALTRWQGILERAPSAITLFRLLHLRGLPCSIGSSQRSPLRQRSRTSWAQTRIA